MERMKEYINFSLVLPVWTRQEINLGYFTTTNTNNKAYFHGTVKFTKSSSHFKKASMWLCFQGYYRRVYRFAFFDVLVPSIYIFDWANRATATIQKKLNPF